VFTDQQTLAYSSVPCDDFFDDAGSCPKGEQCDRCHSNAELLYHPDVYKKRFCHQARDCPRGGFCAFAHSRQELLGPHFAEEEEANPSEDFVPPNFKTQWCPIGGPHNWENCVYAHTYRDFRRVPVLGYSSQPCRRWSQSIKQNAADTDYLTRCPLGFACPMAHGAKEQLYHPNFYKSNPCNDPGCRRGSVCAFTHGERGRAASPNSGKAMRKAIPNAELILARYQPAYARPPVYQALEEPEIVKPRGKKAANKMRVSRKGSAQEAAVPLLPGQVGADREPTNGMWSQTANIQIPTIRVSTCTSFYSEETPMSQTPTDFSLAGLLPTLEEESKSTGWRTASSLGPGTPVQSWPSTPRISLPPGPTSSPGYSTDLARPDAHMFFPFASFGP